jgi:hypothetical protein
MARFLKKKIYIGIGLLGVFGALVLYHTVDPTSTHLFPKCLFLEITGLYCPGCGSQRAVHALLNGEWAAAIGFNAMLVIALPAAMIGWAVPQMQRYSSTTTQPRFELLHRTIPVLVIGFWIARNLPVYPFSVLAP